jgi:hydroxyacylglutathione hydrolase
MYLVLWSEKALLVDTGIGVGDLTGSARSLTPLLGIVVNTHGLPDHAGGNGGFEEAHLHPADEPIIRRMCADEFRLNDLKSFHGVGSPEFLRMKSGMAHYTEVTLPPVCEGMIFDLGGWKFEAIEIPGHTPGGVSVE